MSGQILFSITRKEFRVDFFRAGGKGGQKQNKTSSACRITHLESGAVGECREERHQHTNKKRAFERLIEHPKFKTWLKLKTATILQGYKEIEEKIDDMMRPENLKIEILDI